MELLPHSDIKYHTTPPSTAEIIDLITDYYAEDPRRRGVSKQSGCLYRADTSELGETYCAIGVFIEDTDDISGLDHARNIDNWTETNLEDVIMDPYKGHPKLFWSDLQIFHDNKANFHPISGLTLHGEQKVRELHADWD